MYSPPHPPKWATVHSGPLGGEKAKIFDLEEKHPNIINTYMGYRIFVILTTEAD